MSIRLGLCTAFLFVLLLPSVAVAHSVPSNGPKALASALRHHHIERLGSFLASKVLINDDNTRSIVLATRTDTLRALRAAGIAQVLRVGLVCVAVRTARLVRIPYTVGRHKHRLFHASSPYLDFAFNQGGSIAGLIFASHAAILRMC
jgi:hypothetical protein